MDFLPPLIWRRRGENFEILPPVKGGNHDFSDFSDISDFGESSVLGWMRFG